MEVDKLVGIWTGGFEGSNRRENEVLEDMRIWDKSIYGDAYVRAVAVKRALGQEPYLNT